MENTAKRATLAGISGLLIVRVDLKKIPSFDKFIEDTDNVACSVGIHPNGASTYRNITKTDLISASKWPKVVAIGECGLDYHYDNYDKEDQKRLFREHIMAAIETKLPIIIHSREADIDTIQVIKETIGSSSITGVIHCFSGSWKFAKEAIDLGLYISASGVITYHKNKDLFRTFSNLPIERILIETDSPFLRPDGLNVKSNEPAYLIHVANRLAELKDFDFEDIAHETTTNFFKAFPNASKWIKNPI